nr:hypothetical protein [uncultured Desulfobacter sp.]
MGEKSILVDDFVENYEVIAPLQSLPMMEHAVHAVCPDNKDGEFVGTTVHGFEGD